MRIILSYLLILSGFIAFAQDKAPTLPRFSVRGNIGIPKVTSSEAFRNSFSGVITTDGNIDCRVFGNMFVGVGYEYTYYKTQKYFRDKFINTNLQSQYGYIKFGYDHFFRNDAFVTFSLNGGYNFNRYHSIPYKNDSLRGKYPTSFSSSFVEPMIGVYFIVDPNFAIGGHLSYNYNFSMFDPKYPNYDKWFNYGNVTNKWNMSMITLGFGFYYGLERKK